MADRIERERGGSMGILGVVIGALIVIAVAFFLLSGNWRGGTATTGAGSPAVTAPSTGGGTGGGTGAGGGAGR